MKRTRLRKTSNRGKLIKEVDSLFLKVLLAERGKQCEICGKREKTGPLGQFHILPKGKYPGLRYCKSNVLIAGWMCCHQKWHHSYYSAREIEKRIKVLRGEDYELRLKVMDKRMPKLTMHQLNLYKQAFIKEVL